MRKRTARLVALAALAGLLAVRPSLAAHDTDVHCVPATAVHPSCGSDSHATIGDAIAHADAGDTVIVGPGVYTEIVVVTKRISLLGARAGADARTRSGGPESVLRGGGLAVLTDNVVVDGFTVEDVTAETSWLGTGLYMAGAASGHIVRNNIIRANTFGLYLNGNGVSETLVQRNLFVGNNRPGAASGNGIYSDQNFSKARVDQNEFTGHESAAMVFAGGTGGTPTGQSNLTISNNELVDDNSIVLFNTSASRITGNTITGAAGSGLFIGGNVNGLDVIGNTITGGAARGVRIAPDFFGVPQPSSKIKLRYNAIFGNAGTGVDVTAGRYTGVLDIRHNWWGSPSGPAHGSNPLSGNPAAPAAEEVGDGTDFTPWCLESGCTAEGALNV